MKWIFNVKLIKSNLTMMNLDHLLLMNHIQIVTIQKEKQNQHHYRIN